MPGMMLPGGSTGNSLPAQAPIRGLQRAFQQPQGPMQMMPAEGDEELPDRSMLGQRDPSAPMAALMDVMRRFGKVY